MKLELFLEDYPEGFPNVSERVWTRHYADNEDCVAARALKRNNIDFYSVLPGEVLNWKLEVIFTSDDLWCGELRKKGYRLAKGERQFIKLQEA